MADRHDPDVVSLVLGLLLVAVAGVFLLIDLSDRSYDLRWVGPAGLIAIGALGLLASVRRRNPS